MQRRQTERRLGQFSILSALEPVQKTCCSFVRLYEVMSTLPPPDAELSQVLLQESGKRQWELSRTGYLNWAVVQLLDKTKVGRGVTGEEEVERVKAALSATEEGKGWEM
jgi:kinetochore protein Mis12/MTW1